MTRQESARELNSDIQLLRTLLGNVLRSHARKRVLVMVERLRAGFAKLRGQDDPQLRARLIKLITSLDAATLTDLIRAFSIYFGMVNIAEEAHEHRRRMNWITKGGPLWRGSFDQVVRETKEAGIGAEECQRLLQHLVYMPVFTAHPTEAKRRTLLETMRRIFLLSEELHTRRLHPEAREDVLQQIQAQIQILWKTDEVRVHKPQVLDEVRNGLYFFRESLFQAVPQVYRNLGKAVRRAYGSASGVEIPSLLRFGSWIGGDRDGNPYVKPETTELAVRLHHETVLQEYLARVVALARVLSHSSTLVQPSAEFLDSLDVDEEFCQEFFSGECQRDSHEPYRRKLTIMQRRLDCDLRRLRARMQHEPSAAMPVGYDGEKGFLSDLYLIRDSLISHGDGNTAAGEQIGRAQV